jgi:hypothetical protein
VPPGTNDPISSVRIFGDAEVTVYGDANFEGPSRTFGSRVPDLRGFGLNDRISSFRTDRRGVGTSGTWNNGRWGDDPSGLRAWTQNVIDHNWTEQDLIDQLKQSDEYRENHRRWR